MKSEVDLDAMIVLDLRLFLENAASGRLIPAHAAGLFSKVRAIRGHTSGCPPEIKLPQAYQTGSFQLQHRLRLELATHPEWSV